MMILVLVCCVRAGIRGSESNERNFENIFMQLSISLLSNCYSILFPDEDSSLNHVDARLHHRENLRLR